MHLVVAGGAGYIGSVVSALLIDAGHGVTVIDDLSTGHRDAVPPAARFVELDIADVRGLADVLAGADGVLHFAARSLVGESVRDPGGYWAGNVVGSLALLEAMRVSGVPRLVFSSSAATYGEPAGMTVDEDAPTRPTSAYGATKLAIDLAIADYARAYGLGAVSLRYFNVAGALRDGGRWYGERHRDETHLIPLALRAANGDGELPVFGVDYPTADGTCVRDYVHVVDLADAHIRALDAARPGTHQVINLGSGRGYTVREVLQCVESVTHRQVPVLLHERRAGDPARLVASIERAERVLGWRPRRDLAAMVADASTAHPVAAAH